MIINRRRLKGMQAYKEKGTQDYMIVDMLSINQNNQLDGLSASIGENPSSLSVSVIHSEYLSEKCRPVTWKEVPQVWKDAFLDRLEFPEVQFRDNPSQQGPAQKKLF